MSDDKHAGKEIIKTDLEFYSNTENCDPAEERRLLRKLDLKLIPFLALLYLCSFLDRVNIGRFLSSIACEMAWDEERETVALVIQLDP